MELTLNLVWLSVCIWLLIVSGPALKRPAAGQTRGMVALALVCAMCLLFPAISITDDLQDNPALAEVTKLKKLSGAVHAVIALLPLIALHVPPRPATWAANPQEELSCPLQRLFTTDLSRRPPPSLLSALFLV